MLCEKIAKTSWPCRFSLASIAANVAPTSASSNNVPGHAPGSGWRVNSECIAVGWRRVQGLRARVKLWRFGPAPTADTLDTCRLGLAFFGSGSSTGPLILLAGSKRSFALSLIAVAAPW